MAQDLKICLVGAGGMSFGPTMVNDVIHTPDLAGARLMLHDIDEDRLAMAHRLAGRLNVENGSPIRVDYSTDPEVAMTGADFTLISAEPNRWEYWKQDYEVPRRFGATHITGENGGPGAVFHSLRSIRTTLGICADLERFCPDTFVVNLTNPMSRVTLAINRHTSLRNVGMCHEFDGGITRLAVMLRLPKRRLAAKAAGINHFTFYTEIRDIETGEDLYPRVLELFEKPFFDYGPRATKVAKSLARLPWLDMLVDQAFTPLVSHMVRTYGLYPCSIDSHIGEYVPFAKEVSHWHPTPVYLHEGFSQRIEGLVRAYGEGRTRIPLHRVGHSPEEPMPIIRALHTGVAASINSVNVPNRGYIAGLPDESIVEVGAVADGEGLHPQPADPLPEELLGFMREQIRLQELVVTAAVTGDPELAFEAVVEDPLSPPSRTACRRMFDELWRLQRDDLPLVGAP